MAYFKARIGPRTESGTTSAGLQSNQASGKQTGAAGRKADPPAPSEVGAKSYFTAKLGSRQPSPTPVPTEPVNPPKPVEPPLLADVRHCPLCQSILVEENGGSTGSEGVDKQFVGAVPCRQGLRTACPDAHKERPYDGCQPPGFPKNQNGLYRCQGRCGARWLETEPGQLVDLAALPFGICRCCARPQALVRGEHGAVCPSSGSEYLLLPQGSVPLAEAALHGLCQCCVPPVPLIQADDHLCCQAKPGHLYERRGNQLHLITAGSVPTNATETLTAIDAALRRNSAHLTVNGLFDLG